MLTPVERCPWCGSRITHAKFVQIQDAIRKDEQRKLAAAEKQIHERLAKEILAQQQKLDAERAKILKQLEIARQEAEKLRRKEIAEVRQILQKDRDAALLKKEAEFARERDALQKKISDMSRRVRGAGGEVAEGGELDLYDALRDAFPEDQVSRTKGKNGGNLIHEVRYKGKSAGKILIDCRPRAAWQHAFVTKLRQDQSEVGAEQALLATSIFPSGKKELFVDSGVIVVAPARVPAMVDVLREIDTDVSAIVEAPSVPDPGAKVLRPAAFRVTSNE